MVTQILRSFFNRQYTLKYTMPPQLLQSASNQSAYMSA